MSPGRMATRAVPLLIGIGLLLSACVESVGYSAPVSGYVGAAYDPDEYGYDYPGYGSLSLGWGGWHHGWDHGHWGGRTEVAHGGGGWGHGRHGDRGGGYGHGGQGIQVVGHRGNSSRVELGIGTLRPWKRRRMRRR